MCELRFPKAYRQHQKLEPRSLRGVGGRSYILMYIMVDSRVDTYTYCVHEPGIHGELWSCTASSFIIRWLGSPQSCEYGTLYVGNTIVISVRSFVRFRPFAFVRPLVRSFRECS